jgi:hypothetical protein
LVLNWCVPAGNATTAVDAERHFVVFDVQTANDDMVRFLSEAVSGVPSIGE